MTARDIEPVLNELPMEAIEFAVSKARTGRFGILGMMEDAWGAVPAEQAGLVLESGRTLLERGIAWHLSAHGVFVDSSETAVELLRDVSPQHYDRSWALMTETLDTPERVYDWYERVLPFVELGLGVKSAVDSWAGGTSEAGWADYRFNITYPPLLLAEYLGALDLCGVPDTAIEDAHLARDAGKLGLEFLSGR